MKKNLKELIGTVKMFNGTFKLYQTDNIFLFLKQTAKDVAKNILDDVDGSIVQRLGRIQPNVKIKSKGMIVGVLSKKEGLFTCTQYPSSVFKFPLKNLRI